MTHAIIAAAWIISASYRGQAAWDAGKFQDSRGWYAIAIMATIAGLFL